MYTLYDLDTTLDTLVSQDVDMSNDPGQEVLFVKRIVDTLMSIIHTAKHNLRSLLIDFKRSEIKQFVEQHSTILKNIYSLEYYVVKDKQINIPNGMRSAYLPVTTTIINLLNGFDIENLISDLEQIIASIENGGPSHTSTQKARAKHSKKLIATTMKKYFVKNPTGMVAFKTAFKDMSDFKKVSELLINNCDPLYEKTIILSKRVQALDTRLDDIITTAEKTKTYDRQRMESLRTTLTLLCDEIEMFGVLSLELQRVEHNFVLVLRSLNSTL